MKRSLFFAALAGLIAALDPLCAAVILAVDIDERDTAAGNAGNAIAGSTQPGFSSFVIAATGGAGVAQTGPVTRTIGTNTVTIGGVAGTQPVTTGSPTGFGVPSNAYDDRRRAVPINGGSFTGENLLRDFIFSRDANDGGLDITVTGLMPSTTYVLDIYSFDEGSNGGAAGGARVSDWFANGTLVQDNYSFRGESINPLPVGPATPPNDAFGMFTVNATSDAAGGLLIQGRRDATSTSGTNPDFGVFLNAFRISEVPEPSAAFFALASAGIAALRRRRQS